MQTAAQQLIRLNLGSGSAPLAGYENLDRKTGQEVYPLNYGDSTVDEVRASHILEHFGFREVPAVLREWVRVLKPGGVLKVAVPDFDWIVRQFARAQFPEVPDGVNPLLLVSMHTAEGEQVYPTESYLFGGQDDENDFHKIAFNEWKLSALMRAVGLEDIRRWKSEIDDCASLAVSLNLEGTKA